MKLLEKEFERSQRYGMWFLTNNVDSHSIQWAVYNVYKHYVLRLRSTDWKSTLNYGLRKRDKVKHHYMSYYGFFLQAHSF